MNDKMTIQGGSSSKTGMIKAAGQMLVRKPRIRKKMREPEREPTQDEIESYKRAAGW